MEWLRLYSEARTDRKLQSLNDGQFRIWFNLLCFMGEQPHRGVVVGYDRELLAVEVAGGDTDLLNETLDRLMKLRIVRIDGDDVTLLNFEKRQYDKPSDHPERVAARVRKHREKKRNADVTPCNALDTDSERDTDTEPRVPPPKPPPAAVVAADKPPPDRTEPFEVLVRLCELTGTDVSELSEATKRRQCNKVKQLLAAGMSGEEQLRCASYLRSQEWRTSSIDFFVIERERSAWEMAGKPERVAIRGSPNGGRGDPVLNRFLELANGADDP
jgi:hypothetical protein